MGVFERSPASLGTDNFYFNSNVSRMFFFFLSGKDAPAWWREAPFGATSRNQPAGREAISGHTLK